MKLTNKELLEHRDHWRRHHDLAWRLPLAVLFPVSVVAAGIGSIWRLITKKDHRG